MTNAQKIVPQAGGTLEARHNGGKNTPQAAPSLSGTINRGKFDPEEYRKNYKVMHVGIGTKHAQEHAQLEELAKRFKVTVSALVWEAIERYIKSGPTAPPAADSNAVGGSAAGYWTAVVCDASGKALDVEVVHVEQRSALAADRKGHTFFRYDRDDAKSRERAMRQAERAAAYFKRMLHGDAKK